MADLFLDAIKAKWAPEDVDHLTTPVGEGGESLLEKLRSECGGDPKSLSDVTADDLSPPLAKILARRLAATLKDGQKGLPTPCCFFCLCLSSLTSASLLPLCLSVSLSLVSGALCLSAAVSPCLPASLRLCLSASLPLSLVSGALPLPLCLSASLPLCLSASLSLVPCPLSLVPCPLSLASRCLLTPCVVTRFRYGSAFGSGPSKLPHW